MSLVQLPHNTNATKPRLPRWILFRSAAYLGGQGITFGDPIVPHAAKILNKGSLNVDVMLTPEVDLIDLNLNCLAPAYFDHAFIGPRLEMMDNPPSMVKTIAGKLREGGHLVVAQNINKTDARFSWYPEGVAEMVRDSGHWQSKATYNRDGMTLQIYKKLFGKKGIEPAKPVAAKRACICRYGALGDMIMITPLIHRLHDDGYEVTMNISPYALPVIEHNPYISNLAIQEREMIPNPELGQYWKEWEGDYARYINLSESLEGRFLKVEGRRDFFTPQEWRIKTGEHNYYDATMRFGGYPNITGSKGELFFTPAEERNAQKFFNQYRGKFVVVWAINGSSHHKVYPSMELVCEDWLLAHNDSVVITVGDQMAKMMEFEHSRLIPQCGKWSVRESLIAAKYANCVIGPETMMTNASGSLGTPTITFLSHSTHEALCKHFEKDYCLEPDKALAPCYPCFQLHYTKESCPVKRMENLETHEVIAEAPACAMDAISPQRVLQRLEEVYNNHFVRRVIAA